MALAREVHGPVSMRIAIPQWQGRIAPVFDAAGNLLLVDVVDGNEIRREEKRLAQTEASTRAAEFLGCGADLLICGAITAPLQVKIATAGVSVIPFICGSVAEVLGAFLNGTLADARFAMPGCQRRRWRGGKEALPVGFAAGCKRGRQGRGLRSVQVDGTGEGVFGVGSNDACACGQCGRKASSGRGPGQMRSSCPKCGAPLQPS